MNHGKRKYRKDDQSLTQYAKKKLKKKEASVESHTLTPHIPGNNDESRLIEHDSFLETYSNDGYDFSATTSFESRLIKHESFLETYSNDGYDFSATTSFEVSEYVEDDELLINDDDCSSDDEFVRAVEINDTQNQQNEAPAFPDEIHINIKHNPRHLFWIGLKNGLDNGDSMKSIVNNFKIMNIICGSNVFPQNKYQLEKFTTGAPVTLQPYCPECLSALEETKNKKSKLSCNTCKIDVNAFDPSNPSYLAIIDPSDSLKKTLECHDEYYNNVLLRNKDDDSICDIHDGHLYQKFVKNLSVKDKLSYATVMFNTDGAPVFKSSKTSIWPLYIMPLEIPFKERAKNVILTGLWFGKSKPNMILFLKMFVDQMNHLSNIGIDCKILNEYRNIKIFPLVASVDTMARYEMNCTVPFSSHYGCDYCEIYGHHFGGSMRYPYLRSKKRNHERWIEQIKLANKEKTSQMGIVTASPLVLLPAFDLSKGLPPDYMHCCLEGVGKRLTGCMVCTFSTKIIGEINLLLLGIRVPRIVGRLSRTITESSFWKAVEWQNWILYYSIPILDEVMKDKSYVKHWALFVDSLFILLKTKISPEQLVDAKKKLQKFVEEVNELYGFKEHTYNMHLLLHLYDSVYNWGPLWGQSTFPFESANGECVKAINGAKGVLLQIVKHLNLKRYADQLQLEIFSDTPSIAILLYNIFTSKDAKNTLKLPLATYFGRGKSVSEEIQKKFPQKIPAGSVLFSKVVLNGCLFTTSEKMNKRSCNYFAQLKDDRIVKINSFIAHKETKKEMIICQEIKVKKNCYSEFIKNYIRTSSQICINTENIKKQCVCIELKQKLKYIIPIANNLHH